MSGTGDLTWRGGDHTGHPTSGEQYRSKFTSQRLGAHIAILQEQGFSYDEALAFITGVAFEIARERGETWHHLSNAKQTLERLLLGSAARTWSLDAVDMACNAVADLADYPPELTA